MARGYRYFPPYDPFYGGQQITAVWFDEFGPSVAHGQDRPATKEEESRMKQIDFARPLRGAESHRPMTVVKEGLTLVKTNDGREVNHYYVVDEHGKQYGHARAAPNEFRAVENVPEPKCYHLHLYRREGAEWRIDHGSDSQIYTKEYAESLSRNWARYAGAKNTVVVKVEV